MMLLSAKEDHEKTRSSRHRSRGHSGHWSLVERSKVLEHHDDLELYSHVQHYHDDDSANA